MEKVKEWRLGSLFSGIGGFELGLERAIPGLRTVWQVEQEPFCQGILRKHWPDSIIYDDVRTINKNNVAPVDILCGGFPCQDISLAGRGGGINEEKSGLWWEYHRIINELQPRIAVLENVPAITLRGLGAVLGSLSEIGYDAEWVIISAAECGAPHKRDRWFCVSYPKGFPGIRRTTSNPHSSRIRTQNTIQPGGETSLIYDRERNATNSNLQRLEKRDTIQKRLQHERERGGNGSPSSSSTINGNNKRGGYWSTFPTQPPVFRRDDGVPNRMDRASNRIRKQRIRALGNAIVPQCSQWIGEKIWNSGLLF